MGWQKIGDCHLFLKASQLATRFRENFTQYEERVTNEVKAAGPR